MENFIDAYRELADYKWKDGFVCENCKGTKYTNGKYPFSRRCSNYKCRKDHSPTANTAFDKLRMPLYIALDIVDIVLNSDKRLKVDDIVAIIEKNRKIKADRRAVWNFCQRIYSSMSGTAIMLDMEVTFYTFLFQQSRILGIIGFYNRKKIYRAVILNTHKENAYRQIREIVKKWVEPGSRISLFDFGKYKVIRRPAILHLVDVSISLGKDYSEAETELQIMEKYFGGTNSDVDFLKRHLNYYVFNRNQGTRSTLMQKLINPAGE